MVVGAFLLQFVANDDQRLSSQLQYGLLTTLKRYKEDSEFGKESRMAWTQLQISVLNIMQSMYMSSRSQE